jgi:hypothetical protein
MDLVSLNKEDRWAIWCGTAREAYQASAFAPVK